MTAKSPSAERAAAMWSAGALEEGRLATNSGADRNRQKSTEPKISARTLTFAAFGESSAVCGGSFVAELLELSQCSKVTPASGAPSILQYAARREISIEARLSTSTHGSARLTSGLTGSLF